jgi:hypothetical protein
MAQIIRAILLCAVVSDGLACFHRVTDAGCQHQPTLTGSGPPAVRNPAFKWVNTALGNIKSAINGTYLAITTNQTRAAIPRRVRVPLQPQIRPRQHDPLTRIRYRQGAAYALSFFEIG